MHERGASQVERVGRLDSAQRVAARAKQVVHGTFGADPRMARRADTQMIFHRVAIGSGQLAIDERRDERVE
ncbi:MAG TPA: hypothetical protein VKE96_00860 [Vicinamibacterales bacterium]|nr:hypothetical protein [Vicinamibacterales bacterium]